MTRGYHGRTWSTHERRLEIAQHLIDPWEVGDAFQTAADTALWVGRYGDALRWADEGFRRSRTGPDVWRASLSWRVVSRFHLGDWDGALDDLRLLEEATPRRGFANYFHVVARSCVALLYELRGERAASERVAALVADETPGTSTPRKLQWLARLAAHRGSSDEALQCFEGREVVARTWVRSGILEARCDVIADLELWDLADETVEEAREFAEVALVEALPLHADRLAGRAALARGDAPLAVEALTRARDGFASLGARWEEALANLWLAEAYRAAGDENEARAAAEAALEVFDELRSVRELDHARSLLSRQ